MDTRDQYLEVDLMNIFRIIRKHSRLVLFTILIFLLPAFYLSFFRKNVYASSFKITSYLIQPQQNLDNNQSFVIISPMEIKKFVSDFSDVYNCNSKYMNGENNGKPLPFKGLKEASAQVSSNAQSVEILLKVYNPKEINAIADFLLDYLNHNEYIKHIKNLEEEKLVKLKNEYELKTKEMEKVKEVFFDNHHGGTQVYNFNIYNDILQAYKTGIYIDSRVRMPKDFVYLTRPLVPLEPETGYVKYFLLCILAGFLAGSFLALMVNKFEA